MGGGEIVEDGGDLVLQPGNPVGAVEPAAVGHQCLARLLPAFGARLLQHRQKIGAQDVGPVPVGLGNGVTLLLQELDVEDIGEIEVAHRCRRGGFLFMPDCRFTACRLFRLHAL